MITGFYQMPAKQSPYLRTNINVGCLMDIPTGSPVKAQHGRYITNGGHNGSVIFVEIPLTIQLKDLVSLDCVSFRKVFASGQVTFTCDGKQIIYTGDNAFNGGDGSTAVVSIWNNKCYIDIRNV